METHKNLILTLVLCMGIMLSWHFFYERPRQERQATPRAAVTEVLDESGASQATAIVPRQQALAITHNERIPIISDKIHGSILLRGLKFDDVSLVEFHEALDRNSKEVALLSPMRTEETSFVQYGWLTSHRGLVMPDHRSVWKADKPALRLNDVITFTWDNGHGLLFRTRVKLDNQYMFRVDQSIENKSAAPVVAAPYAIMTRKDLPVEKRFAILHEGFIGVFNKVLHEIEFSDIEGDKQHFKNNAHGWLGITDKYWLTAIIPDEKYPFDSSVSNIGTDQNYAHRADFVGNSLTILPNAVAEITSYLFTGPKKVNLLDRYAKALHIPLFDRAVDFGWLYFLTKPMFLALKFINSLVHNFGFSIIIFTIFIKALLFPLANKSHSSMYKMRKLQPVIARLREKYAEDKVRFNQELITLYKREKINPMAGCIPILIQIPVFFALYKVLFITIEMRHAPFFGWVKDLSAPDPTSLFNLFGFINWQPPSLLMIGVWPILMGISMFLQQRMNPEPADPIQARVMKFMPLLFTFMFYSFPVGLIIYWTVNNLLTILQQWYINKKMRHEESYGYR